MCTNRDTHLFGSAGDEALVQPESLFLRETLSLVVSKQGTLDLSHARKENKQGERGVEMTGVYKAQCAGDRRQVHLHGNKETGERVLIPRNKRDAFDLFS